MKTLFLILISLFFVANGYSQESTSPSSQIEKIVQYYHEREAFHGNIEVRLGDETIYKKSIGIANEAFDVGHTENSRFMIASVSKQFTAALVLKLAEEGLIDIDALYSEYIPLERGQEDTLVFWDSFTVRDLLTHSANLMRDVRQTEYYSPENYQPYVSGIVRSMQRNVNIFSPFQRDLEEGVGVYSNFGYMLLAHLIEVVTKMDFHQALTNKILNPLQLESTGEFHRMFNIRYMADGYNYADETGVLQKRCCKDTTSYEGSHSLYSDVSDLMTWIEDLTSGASKILSQETINEMFTDQVSILGKSSRYGFGFFIDEFNGYKRVWHDGMDYGYLSLVSAVPDLGLKIVILGNRHNASVDRGDYYTQHMNEEITQIFTQ